MPCASAVANLQASSAMAHGLCALWTNCSVNTLHSGKSSGRASIPVAVLTCKNLTSTIRRAVIAPQTSVHGHLHFQVRGNIVSGDALIFPWHSLHIAKLDSPRTETTPGKGYGVEHSAQVGIKLLLLLDQSYNLSTVPQNGWVWVSTEGTVPGKQIDDCTSVHIQIPSSDRIGMH